MEKYTKHDLDRAIEIAEDAHGRQMRKDGTPYIEHPLAVMRMLEIDGYSIATQITGVLHDVPEDCEEWPVERIASEGGFGTDVTHPLEILTKPKGTDLAYYEGIYIPRTATHPRSRPVKFRDVVHNMLSLTSIENPSVKQILNIEKYGRALVYLSRFPQPRV